MYKYVAWLACVALLCGCHKAQDELPKPTRNGSNTFVCRINGQNYIAQGKPTGAFGPFQTQGVWFAGPVNGGEYDIASKHDFVLTLRDFQDSVLDYPLGGGDSSVAWYNTQTATGNYATEASHGGMVHITRSEGGILAGTFCFDAVSQNGTVVHITDGWFDISQ